MASRYKMADIDRIVNGFINGSLSKSEWNHHAHLIVCTHFLSTYEYHEALLKIKLGIVHSIGLKNTIDRGYHETMTLFWVWAISTFLDDKMHWTLEQKD